MTPPFPPLIIGGFFTKQMRRIADGGGFSWINAALFVCLFAFGLLTRDLGDGLSLSPPPFPLLLSQPLMGQERTERRV